MNRTIIALSVLLSLSFVASANSDFENVIGWNNEGNKIYCDSNNHGNYIRVVSFSRGWVVSDPYIVDGSIISCEFDKKVNEWVFTNEDGKTVSIPYVVPSAE
ncbi:hypothetical protein [Providencia rettgeri]|uniref:hypothetical protein n=1 Tax=Providencia rettgeri TaxID=587 RepID=UPI0024BB8403|nr:hypothetical protein [Providencia rettgeri]WHT81938.1 hypothetical protein KOL65_21695 [Providencia rettgeri]